MPESVESRRAQILDAARICFVDRGFVNTTISHVIALSGGSRSTVYDEFGSKEGLFAAIVADCLVRMELADIPDGPPETVLRKLGLAYMAQLMDPEALALYRVAVGESAHVRQLGEAIFVAGPDEAAATLVERLREWTEDGGLGLDDPVRAARLFLAMVEGDLHRSAVMWNRAPSDEEIAANVEAAVALFLAGALPNCRAGTATIAT